MRIARTILGLVCIVIGALAIAVGVIGVTSFGTAGTLEVTSSRLSTDRQAYALVADIQGISAGFPGSEVLGTTTIGATSVGGKRLFVGLGTGDEVNDYLFGVPFEAVRQNGSAWETLPVPGVEEPAPPEKQKFWLRRSTGVSPSFGYTGGTGTSTLVIMNADGRRGVTGAIRISYVSSTIFPLSVAAIAVGALVGLGGVYLIFRRRRRRPGKSPAEAVDVPTQADADLPTVPTPIQRDTPEQSGAQDERVTVDVRLQRDAGGQPQPESEPEGLPDDWFRRSDANP